MDFGEDNEAWDSITDVCSAGTAKGGGTKKFEFGTGCWAGLIDVLITDFRLKILLNPPVLEVGVLDLLALSWFFCELLAFMRFSTVPPKAKPAAARVLPMIPALADVVGLSEFDAFFIWLKIKQKTVGLQPDIDLFFLKDRFF